jgi:molybdate transport system regulatory protein
MMDVQRRSQTARGPIPRAKVWLEIEGDYVFGRGISDILKAVAETGSIKAAAGKLGRSYRHIWARIKEAEQALGAPLVHTQVGGHDVRRSELTELGADLVRDFDTLRCRVIDHVHREYERLLRSTLARHHRI